MRARSEGVVEWNEAVFTYRFADPEGAPNEEDSAPYVPRSVVVNPYFDWAADRPPRRPLHETVIYETHVKGFTKLHPDIPPELRGTYAGLAHPVSDPLPEHARRHRRRAAARAPVHPRLVPGREGPAQLLGLQLDRLLRAAQRATPPRASAASRSPSSSRWSSPCTSAGIEVILDVVYNHTAEGNHLGPTLSLPRHRQRRLLPARRRQPRYYMDYTGTGNTFNAGTRTRCSWSWTACATGCRRCTSTDFASISPRRWAARSTRSSGPRPFFDLDPAGPGRVAGQADRRAVGRRRGRLPGRQLSAALVGVERQVPRLRCATTGAATSARWPSSATGSRARPTCTRTARAGRTRASTSSPPTTASRWPTSCRTTTSTTRRTARTTATATDDNRSWNCGVEGPTDDAAIIELRRRQQRNFLATLFLSQGVPMLLGGDEIGRTQQGNNNAYCQDNEISWFDWEHADAALLAFVQGLIALRQTHRSFVAGAGSRAARSTASRSRTSAGSCPTAR